MKYYNGYKRTTIQYTIAKVSYTDKDGSRHEKELARFKGYACDSNYELYQTILKHFPTCKKPYVHEIVKTYYWEE